MESRRIAVAGGTGTAGRAVVVALMSAGHQPVVLSRSRGVDVTTGAGLESALAGVHAVIDATNVLTTRRDKAVAFFQAGTSQLLEQGARAGVRQLVVLSIVGCDRVDLGYYFGKRRQEELALTSGQPVSVLRTTQFHDFAGQLLDRVRGPLAIVPRMRVQPVGTAEVAQALVALAIGPAVGRAPDLAGPEVHELPDLARAVLAARGSRRLLVPVRVPGATGKAMVRGALLPTDHGPRGSQTFADWLAAER